ncbi:uncharacterized protein LOC113780537 [Coffea eugenioides]|uniref:uncharacterized protein LOC113780537 n=1 Tax=Coffea eugenioides TaxID=49369 RepID=UPI000F60CB96|nr:uncharacterized protein LOC113780537 [Coffea eugenioides]
MIDPKFELGMKFESRQQFKAAVTEYGIKKGKSVWTCKNDTKRMKAVCRDPCPWFVFASIERALGTSDLVVNTMHDVHENCNHAWKNKNMTSTWLSNRYMERIRSNTKMPVRELRQTVHEDYEVEISKWVARKPRAKVIQLIKRFAEAQYKKIWEYYSNPRFMRLYCCLGPLKKGFKDSCRAIIGLDGCHLKGTYPGQLLTVLGVDPNNGYWPIVWAVVEKEATEQWTWFLKLLSEDLDIQNQCHYTFISDQQKGLDRALAEVLPNCEHRYCVQHLYRNFKKKHPGEALKERFWNIVCCTTPEHFNNAMSNLETYD